MGWGGCQRFAPSAVAKRISHWTSEEIGKLTSLCHCILVTYAGPREGALSERQGLGGDNVLVDVQATAVLGVQQLRASSRLWWGADLAEEENGAFFILVALWHSAPSVK